MTAPTVALDPQRVLIAMPGCDTATMRLAIPLRAELGHAAVTHFPDGESYVRLYTPVHGAEVAIVCTLDHPDEKLLPLLWLAIAARQGGARRVGLIAPYLPYMRQDVIFNAGEIRAAEHFAALLNPVFDWLVTVDPHLHRISHLSEVYRVPTVAVEAAPAIAEWIQTHVQAPFLIGPDEESRQWVEQVAGMCGAPWAALTKTRHSAWHVEVTELPNIPPRCVPVLVDDIISTGRTMLAAAGLLQRAGKPQPVCVGVHAVFAADAYSQLCAASAEVVTCDTIPHPSNQIALTGPLVDAISRMFDLPLPLSKQMLV
ncbi:MULTISPECIES: ribose-phosphate pyrophosphokinase [Ralstonia]|jgi:ribose-phosphate pyrophosphokinase|uniref:ribose-phosphate diphosphokinase n=1 Tax=Ralstonia pickettii OR214 TaxID=1264675 RepID=R0CHC6_RALPI|nr:MULTISPECIES: ribose-phosphate pyrophosphokinase [Ralstonia]MEA3269411.1 ribose-phosphate pyrophosphokinase [Pseudomonadota bacterium]PCI27973.1 MAG: phosphoribosylpyrophosphate synthetase [Candidatus Wolfebacteria bacterium]ENZ76000.1 ribose-phosphate pyrophosphokinase [Ralstonia pickettii OR214]MCM3582960.1 ribose-phosphate pyrophosphokinase [Ralstonia pickettii]OYU21160.1 MAG: phosphoribosylpyrophosphate synthetase [Ralstonia sp. PBBBR1]